MPDFELDHYEAALMRSNYTALSYVWGSSVRTHTIRLNGKIFHITANLWHFLSGLEPTAEGRLWWIDAICINQEDPDEKSEQVHGMRDIYENSSRVFASLIPEPDTDAKHVIDSINMAADVMQKERSKYPDGKITQNVVAPMPHANDGPLWRDYRKFTNHGYWSRAWIVQEATTARLTTIQYGRHCTTVEDVYLFYEALNHISRTNADYSHLGQTHSGKAARLFSIRNKRKQSTAHRLLDILLEFKDLSSSDARDLVFAAMSLVGQDIDGGMRPDYRRSFAETLKDFATQFLRGSSRPLDLLGFCGTRTYKLELPSGWPSWVPIWTGASTNPHLPTSPNNYFQKLSRQPQGDGVPIYAAWPEDIPGLQVEKASRDQYIRINGNTLSIRGFVVAEIKTMGMCLGDVSSEEREALERDYSSRAVFTVLRNWVPKDLEAAYPFTGETQWDAFLTTIVADMTIANDYGAQRGGKAALQLPLDASVNGDNVWSEDVGRVLVPLNLHRFAVTSRGHFALVVHQAEIGDMIVALAGGEVFYILRWKEEINAFWLVGECYLHGFMDGQAREYAMERPDALRWFHMK